MIISKTLLYQIRNEIVELFNVVTDDDFMNFDDELPEILEKNLGITVDWDDERELEEIKKEK